MSLKEMWKNVPVVKQCNFDDLVCENENVRVFRSKVSISDGACYEDAISVKIRMPGGAWVSVIDNRPIEESLDWDNTFWD